MFLVMGYTGKKAARMKEAFIESFKVLEDRLRNPWWVAKEICDNLGDRDTNDGTKYPDSDEVSTCTDKSSGQVRHMKNINEPGLYSLILRSRKPVARAFKRWITHEVIPDIRKKVGYRTYQDKGNHPPH
jgi:prophage antirepressor-like protein